GHQCCERPLRQPQQEQSQSHDQDASHATLLRARHPEGRAGPRVFGRSAPGKKRMWRVATAAPKRYGSPADPVPSPLTPSPGSPTMREKLSELKHRLLEIYDLSMANAVLRWDQATYMPPGGAPARGRQTALLSRIAHEQLTDPAIGHL